MDGKKHHNFKDRTGQRFGFLIAVGPSHSDGKKWLWTAKCDCGVLTIGTPTEWDKAVRRGQRPSCGCMTRATIAKARQTHGMTKHPAYAVWRSMLDRCRLPSHKAWKNYGGRGIVVCDRWQKSFENFWADMGPTYSRGVELDRINNDGNYEPGNCRWATYAEQNRNLRSNVRVGDRVVADIAAELGVSHTAIAYRIKKGLDVMAPPFRERTHCKAGHEWTEANTYVTMVKRKNGNGTRTQRFCRQCRAKHQADLRARRANLNDLKQLNPKRVGE